MTNSELEYMTATRMRELLLSSKASAVELLDVHIDRVKKINPILNAVVALDEDGAHRQARAADDARSSGTDLGKLHGIPMTVKDSFEVLGMPATCGIEELRDYKPAQDAAAVARIRRSGAVIFGKTNVPAGAGDHQTCNTLFGLTRNPWNLDRTVGGSSGGAAAALASGMTPLEFGSDIGGSLRVPAHYCGVYGHKPTFGTVSLEGHIPPPPGHLLQPELAVAGPLARSAGDLELLLDVVRAVELPSPRHENLRDFRVAIWNDARSFPLDSSYAAAIDAFVGDLRRLGLSVDADARPAIDMAESHSIYLQTMFGIIGAGLPAPVRAAIVEAGRNAPADSYEYRVSDAVGQTLSQYLSAAEQRQRLLRAWRHFFESYDVLICPVTPTVAFPHDVGNLGMAAQLRRKIVVDERQLPFMDNLAWPGLSTVANLPATAAPTGHLVGELPAGVQIIGPFLGDRTTLRFAELLEQQLGGFIPPPATFVP